MTILRTHFIRVIHLRGETTVLIYLIISLVRVWAVDGESDLRMLIPQSHHTVRARYIKYHLLSLLSKNKDRNIRVTVVRVGPYKRQC